VPTYPEVAAYSAWNEPNHPLQPFDSSRKTTSRNEHHYGPRWAALYTHYAQRTLCFNDCAIIAADLAQGRVRDNDRVIQYLRDYRAALVRRNGPNRALPTVWGVHPYNDVRRYSDRAFRRNPREFALKETFTRRFVRGVRGAAVWLTEIGSYREGNLRGREINNSESAQAAEVRYLLRRLARAPRVRRLYYYYLCSRDNVGGSDPDTALLRDEVSERCTHRRAAYDEFGQAASRSRDPYANPPAPDTVPNDLP
jgi:hypothetical protein